MNNTLSKSNSSFFVFFAIALLRCLFYVPQNVLGISLNYLTLDFSLQYFINFAFIAALAVAVAFVLSKFAKIEEPATIFIVLLFFIDPFVKYSLLGIAHIIIFAAFILIIYGLFKLTNDVLKGIIVTVFCAVCTFAVPDTLSSIVPVLFFVYILSISDFSAKNSALSKKKILLCFGFVAVTAALCAISTALYDKLPEVTNQINYYYFNRFFVSVKYHLPRFIIGSLPYIAVIVAFFSYYIRIKFNSQGKLFAKAKLIILFAVIYVILILSTFVLLSPESFLISNQLIVITLASMYVFDKSVSNEAITKITDRLKAHPFITISAFIIYTIVTQHLFQSMQGTIWSIVSTGAGTLV